VPQSAEPERDSGQGVRAALANQQVARRVEGDRERDGAALGVTPGWQTGARWAVPNTSNVIAVGLVVTMSWKALVENATCQASW